MDCQKINKQFALLPTNKYINKTKTSIQRPTGSKSLKTLNLGSLFTVASYPGPKIQRQQ